MKPEFKLIRNSKTTTLAITGELTVAASEEFKKQLSLFAQEANDLELSLVSVSSVDISGIQLIHALRLAARARQKKLNIALPTDSGLLELLARTGMLRILAGEALQKIN